MPNIAINNYCNLKCPYCFASGMIQKPNKSITIEGFKTILEFISTTSKRIERVGIIGGEPTIHPFINEILNIVDEFCIKHNTRYLIFTNGIELDRIIDSISHRGHILINVNSPLDIGEENYSKIINNLQTLLKNKDMLKRISIGINLYSGIKDYEYIFELAKKFGFKIIRFSYVAPANKFACSDKDKYYTEAIPLYMDFIRASLRYGIQLSKDCNQIPLCYLSEEEKMDVIKASGAHKTFCNPVIDIDTELNAISCFGVGDSISITRFSNFDELECYFKNKRISTTEANNTGKCFSCSKHENSLCQGGCLIFSK